MSTDFSAREREFVDSLKDETGRDLAAWMNAIAASGHAHRNDIIDWLRQEGFTFSKASWIERIHHNGGKLIYGAPSERSAAEAARVKQRAPAPHLEASPRAPRPAQAATPKATATADTGIEALLLAAKAYRPLAQVLLRDCLAATPGAEATPEGGAIVLSHATAFAAIVPTPKDVRLVLAFGAHPAPPGWVRPKVPPGVDVPAGLMHMIILNDARQLTRDLYACVALCAGGQAP